MAAAAAAAAAVARRRIGGLTWPVRAAVVGLLLTTLLKVSTVNAKRFYAKFHLVV